MQNKNATTEFKKRVRISLETCNTYIHIYIRIIITEMDGGLVCV